VYLSPLALLPKIGARYFAVHPLQKYVGEERFNEIILRKVLETELAEGVPPEDISKVLAQLMPGIAEKNIREIDAAMAKEPLQTKTALRSVRGMNEAMYKNIAGFVVVSPGKKPLDKTLVHPDNWAMILDACNELRISADDLIENPEALRSFVTDTPEIRIFIEKRLIGQLKAGQKFSSESAEIPRKARRRAKLSEIEEGSLVSGKVTNIKPFGVFVDINAVCDGLIHISQLADVYVESPEQIVALNDTVTVRVLKVDPKQRRISLSMKNLGTRAPRVAPSQRQLDSLSTHFQNR
jgi:uncharacterized protein